MTDPVGDNAFGDTGFPADGVPADAADGGGLRSALALLADDAPAPATTDLEAARLAWARAHRPAWPVRAARAGWTALRRAVREHPLLAVPVAAALAVLLLMAVVAGLPSVRLSAPQPARTPDGPGALPDRVYAAQPWTPSVVRRPLSRAAYLLQVSRPAGNGVDSTYFVVGADDGSYRRLPDAAGAGALSRDGRRLAWWTAPESSGPVFATVHVLDLPTGIERQVRMPSLFGVSSSVDQLLFDPSGRRLAVLGGDGWDMSSFLSTGRLLGLGEVGSDDPIEVGPVCRGCGGSLVWLADGSIGHDPDRPPPGFGLATTVLPAEPNPAGESTSGSRLPVLVDPSGTVRYSFASQDPQQLGEAEAYRLLTARGAAEPTSTDLGQAYDIGGIGVVPDGVVAVRQVRAPGEAFATRQSIEIDSAAGSRTLTRVDDLVAVQAVAEGVAAGGRVVPGVRPDVGPSDLDWWSWHLRTPLLAVGGLLAVVVALVLAVGPTGRRWGSTSRRLARRLRPSRDGVVVGVLVTSTVVGVGFLAAPTLVTAALAARTPRPAADAPSLMPHTVADQRWVPPRAFDSEGSPRTTRLTFALATTVAGRAGLYGADAGTARLVRLDDLPGLPWGEAPTQPLFALSPSGRYLAVWDDQPGKPVAVVDLREARVVVQDDRLGFLRGTGGGTPSVGVADDGALLALAPGASGPTTLWRVPLFGEATVVGVVPGAASVAVQSGGAVVVTGRISRSWSGRTTDTGVVLLRTDDHVAFPEADVDGIPAAPAAQSRNALLLQRPGSTALTLEPVVEAGARTRPAASGDALGREQAYARADRVLALQGGPGQQAAAVVRTDEGLQIGLLDPAPATFDGISLLRLTPVGQVQDGPGGIVVAVDAISGWAGQVLPDPEGEPWWTALGNPTHLPVALFSLVVAAGAGVVLLGRRAGRGPVRRRGSTRGARR